MIAVTGGCGFIGHHFVKYLLRKTDEEIIIIDNCTYAGTNLVKDKRVRFQNVGLETTALEKSLMRSKTVFNFAAETHVDNSIIDSKKFFLTNSYGTDNLVRSCLNIGVERLIHISTDEVYGPADHFFKEDEQANPKNPYSISKYAAEQIVLNAVEFDGLDACITRGSNTYGENQHREKLIPKAIYNALNDQKIPIYGDGKQKRTWLNVKDHCRAIYQVYKKGEKGEIYNIPGDYECQNEEIVRQILETLRKPEYLMENVQDRRGHDKRYLIDGKKLEKLGFRHKYHFRDQFQNVVRSYEKDFCNRLSGSWVH